MTNYDLWERVVVAVVGSADFAQSEPEQIASRAASIADAVVMEAEKRGPTPEDPRAHRWASAR